jgi:hypothetical protein
MSTIPPDPQQANIAELLEMIREIGGTAEAFAAGDATRLALKIQALQAKLATHTIIIGVVPTFSSASS